jgi:hypothetical protein
MPNKDKSATRTINLVTFMVLVLAYPVGVVVMWITQTWSVIARIIITIPLIAIVAAIIIRS